MATGNDEIDELIFGEAGDGNSPALCPSWGELTGTGWPCAFSQGVRDEYDRRKPLGQRAPTRAVSVHIEDMTAFELDCLDPAKLSADELRRVIARLGELRRAA